MPPPPLPSDSLHRNTTRRSVFSVILVACLPALGIVLYVLLLLSIVPCRSLASTNLPDWSFQPTCLLLASNGEPVFSPLPPLAVAEKSVAPTRFEFAIKVADFIETIFKVIGLVVGGLFAYWKFFMGRIFHPRLEPAVAATTRTEGGKVFLTASCKLKNVGLVSVDLDKRKSALRVLVATLDSAPQKVQEVRWPKVSAFTANVFEHHEWIEGGESIEDAHLFTMPHVASQVYRVELRVLRLRRSIGERFKEWRRRRRSSNSWSHHAIPSEIADQIDTNEQKNK